MSYTLKYRTFDSLLADVMVDFKKYQASDMIDSGELIKVARKCNYDLGLKIYQTREKILDVEKNRAKLPDDFYVYNYGFLLGKFSETIFYPQGTHMEENIVGVAPKYQVVPPKDVDFCSDPIVNPDEDKCFTCCQCPDSCTISCKGEIVQLTQVVNYTKRVYEQIVPIKLLDHTEDFNGICPGKYWEYPFSAIIKDGWIQTSFPNGKLYINYEGDMQDEEGNLIVLDHPMINEYYEYALKERVIENLMMNGIDVQINSSLLNVLSIRLRAARSNALSIVNTPDLREMKSVFQANRNAMLSKYYDMFGNHPRIKGH